MLQRKNLCDRTGHLHERPFYVTTAELAAIHLLVIDAIPKMGREAQTVLEIIEDKIQETLFMGVRA